MAEYVMSLAREIGSRLHTKCDRLTDAIITGDIGQFECCDYSFTCSGVVKDWFHFTISLLWICKQMIMHPASPKSSLSYKEI